MTEVVAAQHADAAVRAHYAVFRPERLHMARSSSSRLAYVSYRIGNEVFWTRQPLTIPAGELLITDGEYEARARCGNRLAARPQRPFRPIDPAVAELDRQELPAPPRLERTASAAPPFPASGVSPGLPFVAQTPEFDLAGVPARLTTPPADPALSIWIAVGTIALPQTGPRLAAASQGGTAGGAQALVPGPDPFQPELRPLDPPGLPFGSGSPSTSASEEYLEYQAPIADPFSWHPGEPFDPAWPTADLDGTLTGNLPDLIQPEAPADGAQTPEPGSALLVLGAALYLFRQQQKRGRKF